MTCMFVLLKGLLQGLVSFFCWFLKQIIGIARRMKHAVCLCVFWIKSSPVLDAVDVDLSGDRKMWLNKTCTFLDSYPPNESFSKVLSWVFTGLPVF